MDGSVNGVEYALTATVKTPGSGQSSRWHANYSVCDSCYQQRNKGLACLCCGRAYRHSAQREMMQCSTWVLPGPNDDQTSSAAEKKKRVAEIRTRKKWLVFGSLSLFAAENEQMLRSHLLLSLDLLEVVVMIFYINL